MGVASCTGEVSREDKHTYEQSSRKQLKHSEYTIDDKVLRCEYTYTDDGRLATEVMKNGDVQLDRKSYQYLTNGSHKTDLVEKIVYRDSAENTYEYAYDHHGNITEIKKNGALQAKYYYDEDDRLVWESNLAFNETYCYTYRKNGDRVQKSIHNLCWVLYGESSAKETIGMQYTDDKLTTVSGEAIEYDEVGNPVRYLGKTLAWSHGRRLMSYDGVAFEYDEQGRRTKKGEIEFINDHTGRVLKSSNGLQYYYDGTGAVGLSCNGNLYAFRKDLVGNIIAVLDSNANVVVHYEYDAWGNHKVLDANGIEIADSTHIGNINPFRYRGYFYDTETGLYYLKSRYYDPQTGRFINMDGVEYADPSFLNGLNLYAYCNNNPVMYVDPNGTFFAWISRNIASSIAAAAIVADYVFVHILGKENYEDAPSEETKEQVLSTGVTVYFNYYDDGSGVKVYNSYSLTSEERWEFLRYLQKEHPEANLERMNNEWVWHNIAYQFHYQQASTASVDLNWAGYDKGHNLASWVMNNVQIFQRW